MKLPRLPRRGNILEAKYTAAQMKEYGRRCVYEAADRCINIAWTAEPYKCADLICKEFGIKKEIKP